MEAELGRLIRSLKEKCECGHTLQLRGRRIPIMVRGEEQFEEQEYKVCGFCGNEIEIPLRQIKKRIVHIDKTAYIKPVEEKRRYNASDKKRISTKSGDAKTSGRSSRGSSR